MRSAQLAVFVLAGCAMTPAKAAVSSLQDGLPLPPARGPLEIPADTNAIGLTELLEQFARLTGQELVMDPQTQNLLQMSNEPLEILAPVPAGEVYGFVEGLLAHHGFVIAPIKGGSRPMLGIYSAQGAQASSLALTPLPVDVSRLDLLDGHPALLVRTQMMFENIDSRQLQTQLRQLLVDSAGFRQCVPLGEAGLLLQGAGRDTASLVRLLKEVDAATKRSVPAPEQTPQVQPLAR